MRFIEKRDRYKNYSVNFFKNFKESILTVDLNVYTTKYADASKKIFGKDKAIDAVSKELGQHTNFTPKQEQLAMMANDIDQYKSKLTEYEEAKKWIK